jgi:DNA end-binding protein Ku
MPGKRGEKAYALLRETMKRADRAAIAKVVIMTKQHLAAVLAMGDMLVLNTLRFADEIREAPDVAVPSSLKQAGVSEREIDMALKLVESMAEPWQPEHYHDTYREDLLARVEDKVKHGDTEEVPEPAAETEGRRSADVVDLVALLQNSLRSKGKAGGKPAHERAGEGAAVKSTQRGAAASAKTSSHASSAHRPAAAKKSRERKRA